MIFNHWFGGGKNKGTARVTIHADYKYDIYGLLNGEINYAYDSFGEPVYDIESIIVVNARTFPGYIEYTNVSFSENIELVDPGAQINDAWVPFLVHGDGDIYYS